VEQALLERHFITENGVCERVNAALLCVFVCAVRMLVCMPPPT
jgi:hypothetical protein